MKRLFLVISATLLTVSVVFAQPSPTYYIAVDGLKKVDLKLALKSIISNHTKLSYSSELPEAYKSVYYIDGDISHVYDMYSNALYTYSGSSWNKEHVVPNSWWGGVQNNAYSDIFSVIPSESVANNRKSNYPVGEVGNVTWTNDCIKIGMPVSGQGGSYNYVFEPSDEYKGDFARIYFYVATCYSDIGWGSKSTVYSELEREDWPTLHPWLYKLLLKWHNVDPVSQKEIEINNDAEEVQGNRNPFIDYPVLADYIWGTYTSVAFNLDSAILYKHVSGTLPIDPEDTDTIVVPVDTTSTLVVGDTLLADNFNEITSGNNYDAGGSSDVWTGDDLFPTVSTVYKAGGAVRLGSSKKSGSITSKIISYEGGPMIVELKVKGWSSVEGNLIVQLGEESKTVNYSSTMTDNFQTITLPFYNIKANPTLSITTSAKRCFVDDVIVQSASIKKSRIFEDVNIDGNVDTQDVLNIYQFMQYAIGTETNPSEDVNQDNSVDTQDVLSVYDYIQNQ